jgi:hypothetical protein
MVAHPYAAERGLHRDSRQWLLVGRFRLLNRLEGEGSLTSLHLCGWVRIGRPHLVSLYLSVPGASVRKPLLALRGLMQAWKVNRVRAIRSLERRMRWREGNSMI